ncbi:actin cortical patch SUR7/pH-response regulator pali [Roridomyces roridus]|uniref:Actin cortical patch SUR7/pH-response regulator pali n=1 Tax=Roridomyces roridus TaxID=1738132 RepID=A0AAD7BTK8_9AGAR|nr:actin cortical patch SUR7/pH-response regulator pali [Roridomyces roridus]
MRGEICVGAGSFLALASLLLLIFVHVSQINTSTVPRGISMIKVNVSGYGEALHVALIDDIQGLYTNDSAAPLGVSAGLRQFYQFGLYSHCGYVNASAGICSNHSTASPFEPYTALTSDMLSNYSQFSDPIVGDNSFKDGSLGKNTRAAYYMILLGTICAALALLTGVVKYNLTFFLSTGFAVLGSVFLLVGASIWTAVLRKAQAINPVQVGLPADHVQIGILVSMGHGLPLLWAAFASLLVSIVPYMIRSVLCPGCETFIDFVSCCTFRG